MKRIFTILFGTQVGERVLELDYGTDLGSLLFERLPLTEKAIMENTQYYWLTSLAEKLIPIASETPQSSSSKTQIFNYFGIITNYTRY